MQVGPLIQDLLNLFIRHKVCTTISIVMISTDVDFSVSIYTAVHLLCITFLFFYQIVDIRNQSVCQFRNVYISIQE